MMLYHLTWVCVGLQHYSEINNVCYHHINSCKCIRVYTTTLANGTYELVPESESEQRKAQVNLTEVSKDSNQCSEEPKASNAQKGKPQSITYYFQLYATYHFYICVFKFIGVD
jgi:hypothetical protein